MRFQLFINLSFDFAVGNISVNIIELVVDALYLAFSEKLPAKSNLVNFVVYKPRWCWEFILTLR
jgi:hypothetical protein